MKWVSLKLAKMKSQRKKSFQQLSEQCIGWTSSWAESFVRQSSIEFTSCQLPWFRKVFPFEMRKIKFRRESISGTFCFLMQKSGKLLSFEWLGARWCHMATFVSEQWETGPESFDRPNMEMMFCVWWKTHTNVSPRTDEFPWTNIERTFVHIWSRNSGMTFSFFWIE